MEYLIGLITGLVLFALLATAYYMGTRTKKSNPSPLSELEQRKMEQIKKGFDEVMNYSVEKARSGK